jgi:hypothetical protein
MSNELNNFATGGLISGVDFGSGESQTVTPFIANLNNTKDIPLPAFKLSQTVNEVSAVNVMNVHKESPMPKRPCAKYVSAMTRKATNTVIQGNHSFKYSYTDLLKGLDKSFNSKCPQDVQFLSEDFILNKHHVPFMGALCPICSALNEVDVVNVQRVNDEITLEVKTKEGGVKNV